jgi:hypothetical protein
VTNIYNTSNPTKAEENFFKINVSTFDYRIRQKNRDNSEKSFESSAFFFESAKKYRGG